MDAHVAPAVHPSNPAGSDDSRIRLSRSSGGVRNVALEPWSPTFEELVEAMSAPVVGDKDGSYFVRGPCDEGATRRDDGITEANLIVLDGDKSFDPTTGEITNGAPHPAMVHGALRDLNVRHHIFTSHSHLAEGKGNRYRVLVPAHLGADRGALLAGVDYLLKEFWSRGVPLAHVSENYGWSQPWYFPRLRSVAAPFHSLSYSEGEPLVIGPILQEWTASQSGVSRNIAILDAEGDKESSNTVIRQYLAEHGSPECIAAYLEIHGYVLMGAGHVNDSPAYRFLAPGSDSGSPGVVLFCSRRGRWRVTSFHGGHDPLAQRDAKSGKSMAHDAFDLFCILEHGGDQSGALTAVDPRPVIRVRAGSLHESTRDAIQALAAQDPPEVFQRGNMLVRPVHLPDLVAVDGVSFPKGTAVLATLDATQVRLQLARTVQFVKPAKEEWTATDPPRDVAQTVHRAVGDWEGIPVMAGIADAPILRSDGSIFDQEGYDPQTRMYFAGRAPSLILPAEPGLSDARRALEILREPFAEFSFTDPEQDFAVVLAYVLTLALRPTLPRAPLFAFTATAPGSGKGLIVQVSNLIIRGKDAAIMAPAGGSKMDEETRKRITSILLQGASSVLLDNFTSEVGGDSLNTLFTSDEWTDRVLGISEMVTLPTRVTWAVTGNNLLLRGDMTRRSVVAELDPGVERPELRRFVVDDLPQYVLANRRELLSAVYTILQAYIMAGEPESGGTSLGRFEEWSRFVAAPIRWIGLPDPILSQERLREEDPEIQKLAAVLLAWHQFLGEEQLMVAEVVTRAQNGGGFSLDPKVSALKEALQTVAGAGPAQLINPRTLGNFLRKFEGRICEGLLIEKDNTRTDRALWRVIKKLRLAA